MMTARKNIINDDNNDNKCISFSSYSDLSI